GDYVASVLPQARGAGVMWAAAIVAALTVVNVIGLRVSAGSQNLFTLIEVGGLVVVALAGFAAAPANAAALPVFASSPAPGLFGLAMVFVLLTYGGWNEAAYLS